MHALDSVAITVVLVVSCARIQDPSQSIGSIGLFSLATELSAISGKSRGEVSGLAPFSSCQFLPSNSLDSSVVFDNRSPTHLLSSIARSIDLYYLSLIHRSCHNVQERLAPVVPDGGSNLCQIRREYPNRLDHRPKLERKLSTSSHYFWKLN
jgi:hypothetical protein